MVAFGTQRLAEPEVGWAVFDKYEGKSIAYEAACRVRRWAYECLSLKRLQVV